MLISLAFLCVSACTPLSLYHREGVPVARMENDLLGCRVNALDKAPVANQVRRGAPYYVPGYRYCNGAGHCYRRGGYYRPGDLYTVDVNASLRRDVESQCMAQKGYTRVTIPDCPVGTSVVGTATRIPKSADPTSRDVLPAIDAQTCAVRGEGGDWKIISPIE